MVQYFFILHIKENISPFRMAYLTIKSITEAVLTNPIMESSIDEVDADHSLVDGVARVHHDVGREDEEEESNATSKYGYPLN